jgi:hypothetical protein
MTFITVIIRALLQAVAGGLMTDGFVTDAQIQLVSGAILTVVTVVWSVLEKKYLAKK